MHELSMDGIISADQLGEFIATAYEVYEAY